MKTLFRCTASWIVGVLLLALSLAVIAVVGLLIYLVCEIAAMGIAVCVGWIESLPESFQPIAVGFILLVLMGLMVAPYTYSFLFHKPEGN